MSFTFTINANKADNMLMLKIAGFISSLSEYEQWERAIERTWQTEFQHPVKILSDQRDFKPMPPEILARVKQYRMRKAPLVIATATIVEDVISQMQLKRLSAQSGLKDRENFFVDVDEAVKWLKKQ